MCNQMVTSEIREWFHVRFVQILIVSLAFHEYTIWLPINIMGHELR